MLQSAFLSMSFNMCRSKTVGQLQAKACASDDDFLEKETCLCHVCIAVSLHAEAPFHTLHLIIAFISIFIICCCHDYNYQYIGVIVIIVVMIIVLSMLSSSLSLLESLI